MTETSELEKFNRVLRKVMAVPREEILKRDKAWQRKQARKKRAKTSPPPAFQPQRVRLASLPPQTYQSGLRR